MEAAAIDSDPPAAPLVPASVVAAAVSEPIEVTGCAAQRARPNPALSSCVSAAVAFTCLDLRRRGWVPCWSAPQVTAVSCGSSHSLAILSGLPRRLPSMHPGALMRGLMYDQCAKTPPCIAGVHPPASCMPVAQLACWLMECSVGQAAIF